MRSLVFFNNKGGVGKTTLTFNLAHMLARQGRRVLVLDYDPQCNISAIFLDEQALAEIWEAERPGTTVKDCLDLVRRGKGEVVLPCPREVADGLWLLPGHLGLSRFEQTLAEEFGKTLGSNNERALDVTTALDLLSDMAAQATGAEIVLIDVGPSLGALNRAALLGCDHVVLPVAPDLFSLQGLRNVGPTLRDWRSDWELVRDRGLKGRARQQLAPHAFEPLGYVVQQHLARSDRPVVGHRRWAEQLPTEYHLHVLGEPEWREGLTVANDPHCLALLPHYASLVPIAQEARKPIFDLKQADGVSGGQTQAVARCRTNFEGIARTLLDRLGLSAR